MNKSRNYVQITLFEKTKYFVMSVLEISKVNNTFFSYIMKAIDMLVSNSALNAFVETAMANMDQRKYVTAAWNVAVQEITKTVAEVMQIMSTTLNMNVRK